MFYKMYARKNRKKLEKLVFLQTTFFKVTRAMILAAMECFRQVYYVDSFLV
jgi:hypothetical protein